MFTVRVVCVNSMSRFTPRHTGIISAPTAVLYATAAAAGQPMSNTLSCRPYMPTTVSSAGPSADVSRAVTIDRPMKPTPTLRPLFRASPSRMPMHSPRTVKMTGIITAAPRLIM